MLFKSKRSLLAFLWSIVCLLTALAFGTAAIFAASSRSLYGGGGGGGDDAWDGREGGSGDTFYVTSRALAFTALWMAALAVVMSAVGTVVLGWVGPTGRYYWCCRSNILRTTPLSLGGFIGGLLMFANLTLVCAGLFAEFKIKGGAEGHEGEDEDEGAGRWEDEMAVARLAFSVVCAFLTVMYGGFAALVYANSDELLEENRRDLRREEARAPDENGDFSSAKGFGERVGTPGSAVGSAVASDPGMYSKVLRKAALGLPSSRRESKLSHAEFLKPETSESGSMS